MLSLKHCDSSDLNIIFDLETYEFPYVDVSKECIRYYIKNGKYLRIVLDGKIAGYINISPVKTFTRIYSIIIKKEFRGKGLGTSVLRYLKETHKNLTLAVAKNNKAKKLYKREGFIEYGSVAVQNSKTMRYELCATMYYGFENMKCKHV